MSSNPLITADDVKTAEQHREENLAQVETEIERLAPSVAEYARLVAAHDELVAYRALLRGEVPAGDLAEPEAPAAPVASNGSTSAPASAPKRRASRSNKPATGGSRRDQVLQYVTDHPGTRIPDLEKALKVAKNYLYKVRDGLVEDKAVVNVDGKLYLPEDAPKG